MRGRSRGLFWSLGYAGLLALPLVVLAHYAIFRIAYPATLEPAWPGAAPWYMTAGRAAVAVFLVLVISSLARKALRIEYDHWRLAHTALAVLGMALAVIHVLEEPHEGWEGAVGRPTPEILERALARLPEGARCFMCGPEPMTNMAEAALRARGVRSRHIHSELFDMA